MFGVCTAGRRIFSFFVCIPMFPGMCDVYVLARGRLDNCTAARKHARVGCSDMRVLWTGI